MKNAVIQKAVKCCGSQRELARLCNVTQGAVGLWVRGGGINAKYIPLIAKATNGEVSESEILQSLTATAKNEFTRRKAQ